MQHLNLSGLPFASRTASGDDNFAHDHDFIEIFFITEGEIVHNILNSSKKLSEGNGVIIATGVPHFFSRAHSCIHRDNMLSVELFKDCCAFLDIDLYDELCKKKYIEFSITTEQIKFYEKNVISFLNSGNATQMKKQERFLSLLLLGFIVFPDSYDNSALSDFQTQCLNAITENFTKPNAIELMYERIPLNKSYLSKKFKDVFGMPMTDYINELRIKHAAYLLSVTDYTLPHICESIGIASLPYFNKLFKNYYKITPAKYRKSNIVETEKGDI